MVRLPDHPPRLCLRTAAGNAGKTFANAGIQAVAARHNVSAAQTVLRWNVQLGIPVIPQATDPTFQEENISTLDDCVV